MLKPGVYARWMRLAQNIRHYFHNRRHRRMTALFPLAPGEVLDISCGDGDLLNILHTYAPERSYHGVDMSAHGIAQVREHYPWGTWQAAHAEALPYPDASFGTLLSCMSLHHYAHPREVLVEAARVLTSGGVFHIADMMPRRRWSQLFLNWYGCGEPYHFERYWREDEVAALAHEAGLAVVASAPASRLSSIRVLTLEKVATETRPTRQ